MHFYLSGPMRGRPELNRLSFEFYSERLVELGHTVFSPWTPEDAELPMDCKLHVDELQEIMARDLLAISQADAVLLMPEWQTSHGAVVERIYAHFIGRTVVDWHGKVWLFSDVAPVARIFAVGTPVPVLSLSPRFLATGGSQWLRCPAFA